MLCGASGSEVQKALVQHQKAFCFPGLFYDLFYKLNVDETSCGIIGAAQEHQVGAGCYMVQHALLGYEPPVLLKSIIADGSASKKGRPFVFRKGGRADKDIFRFLGQAQLIYQVSRAVSAYDLLGGYPPYPLSLHAGRGILCPGRFHIRPYVCKVSLMASGIPSGLMLTEKSYLILS